MTLKVEDFARSGFVSIPHKLIFNDSFYYPGNVPESHESFLLCGINVKTVNGSYDCTPLEGP